MAEMADTAETFGGLVERATASALIKKLAEVRAENAALREENTKLKEDEPDLKTVFREVYTAYKNLQRQYDDVREEGKITTIYDNEKGVCIHVPDDKWYESVDEDNMATGELKEWFAAKGWHNVTFDDFEGKCDNPEEHLKSGMPSTHRWQKFIEPEVEPKVESELKVGSSEDLMEYPLPAKEEA